MSNELAAFLIGSMVGIVSALFLVSFLAGGVIGLRRGSGRREKRRSARQAVAALQERLRTTIYAVSKVYSPPEWYPQDVAADHRRTVGLANQVIRLAQEFLADADRMLDVGNTAGAKYRTSGAESKLQLLEEGVKTLTVRMRQRALRELAAQADQLGRVLTAHVDMIVERWPEGMDSHCLPMYEAAYQYGLAASDATECSGADHFLVLNIRLMEFLVCCAEADAAVRRARGDDSSRTAAEV